MEITHEVWTAITGLKYAGLRINKGSIGAGNQRERILSMSPFERFMVNRMDNFAENRRNLHDCATNFQNFDERFQSMDTRFQNLNEQIEAVQNQLFELQYRKED